MGTQGSAQDACPQKPPAEPWAIPLCGADIAPGPASCPVSAPSPLLQEALVRELRRPWVSLCRRTRGARSSSVSPRHAAGRGCFIFLQVPVTLHLRALGGLACVPTWHVMLTGSERCLLSPAWGSGAGCTILKFPYPPGQRERRARAQPPLPQLGLGSGPLDQAPSCSTPQLVGAKPQKSPWSQFTEEGTRLSGREGFLRATNQHWQFSGNIEMVGCTFRAQGGLGHVARPSGLQHLMAVSL